MEKLLQTRILGNKLLNILDLATRCFFSISTKKMNRSKKYKKTEILCFMKHFKHEKYNIFFEDILAFKNCGDMKDSVNNVHTNCLKFLYDHYSNEKFILSLFEMCIKQNNFRGFKSILKETHNHNQIENLLVKNELKQEDKNDKLYYYLYWADECEAIMKWAVKYNRQDMIKYMEKTEYFPKDMICEFAIEYGNFEILKYAFNDKKYKIYEHTFLYGAVRNNFRRPATENGFYECFKFCIDHKTFDMKRLFNAASESHYCTDIKDKEWKNHC